MKTPAFLVGIAILFVLLFMPGPELCAQQPGIRALDVPEEMQQTSITCLYQDTKGYMWIGTGKGLFGYDGLKFQAYYPIETRSVQHITAVFMDRNLTLWVGTKKGQIYTLQNDSLKLFELEEGLPAVAITGFESDLARNLWISTYGEGLYCYSSGRLYNFNTDDGLSDNYCYSLIKDSYDRIWTSTDGGISVCVFEGKRKSIQTITTNSGLPDNIVMSLCLQGFTMWAGMQDAGICGVDIRTLQVLKHTHVQHPNSGSVKTMLLGKNRIWLSGEREGIRTFNTSTYTFQDSVLQLDKTAYTGIQTMLADKQGNYWIASGSKLYISMGREIEFLSTIKGENVTNVHSVLVDSRNRVWFSTEKGLHLLHPETGKEEIVPLPVKSKTRIISLFEDNSGVLWAGTFGSGLIAIELASFKTRLFTEKEGLLNGNILSIAGKRGKLWLATLGGAFSSKNATGKFTDLGNLEFVNYGQQQFPGNNYIYDVVVDSKNRIWYATDGKGISMLHNARYTHFNQSNGLKSNTIYSIEEDANGKIWFSSARDGLYCYDDGKIRSFSQASGLSGMQITGLLAYKNYMLIIHNKGVDVMDINTEKFYYYGPTAGLIDIQPDLNACSVSADGIAWIGTQNGLIRIELPENIEGRQPKVQINKLSVFLGAENKLGTRDFSYKNNHISFHYSAYWYQSPTSVKFQIKLDGYDRDWIETRNSLITYSDLQPGTYTFHVRASLNDNFEKADTVTYTFEIKKPFWQTSWFIILTVLLIALLAYSFIHFREKSLRKKESAGREKILFQLQTLRSQVNPHFLFNSFSTLISIIDEDKEVAIEYVEKLSEFFRNILEYKDKDLILLSEELRLIETYTYLQKKRFCTNLDISISIMHTNDSMLIPPMVLQMLVENAVKHNIVSTDFPLKIEIEIDASKIRVSNTLQPKKEAVPSTGIGLENIRNRYRLLGYNTIYLNIDKNTFTVILPVIYA